MAYQKHQILAKKRFTDGLDSLFGGDDQASEKELSLFPEESKSKGRSKRDDEKQMGKGFSSQLDAFLAEAFEAENEKNEAEGKKKAPKRLAGLDLLIRQTTAAPPRKHTTITDKRRLTLAFDKKQLKRLKDIAEQEGVYLKDLINQLIERYLQEQGE